ncbi:MAG: hypothetical protein JWO94_3547 [Verrucomicrobiaceae bacterium]|nr:hypothetical protein [Verrucomicrobiaceae bacterium]
MSDKKRVFLLILLLLVTVGLWLAFRGTAPQQPRIPGMFASSLPPGFRQVVLVLAPNDRSETACLWLMERPEGDTWHAAAGPIPVTLGHQGLAWGKGEHTALPPAGFRIKHEGDKCSPAGVFRLPFAFGLAAAPEATWLKLPYTPLTPSIVGVDDPKSSHYNQIVDNTQVPVDWDSNEPMQRIGHLYEWGAFIAHNPEGTPGLGSCIFLHLWPGPGEGTAGCTAMAEDSIKQVLGWLDPVKEPRLVQGVEGW